MAASDREAAFQTKGGAGYVPVTSSEPWKFFTGAKRASGYGSSTTASEVAGNFNGKGKVAIITGGSSGLGVESGKVLASRGVEVILAVRNTAKGQEAAVSIKAAIPDASVSVMEVDLNSLASVKAFADEFKLTGRELHILMLNAGIMATPFTLSKEGYEAQFATNHLGHFLLVHLLLDNLTATAKASNSEGRIVVLSSYAHAMTLSDPAKISASLKPEALRSPEGYQPIDAYARSKLANVLFTRQLNMVIKVKGLPIVAAVCHPGYILATGLFQHVLPRGLKSFAVQACKCLGKTIPQGAATQVYLATAPQDFVLGGEYYGDCNLEVSSTVSHSRALAKELWETSEQLCKDYLF